MSSTIKKPLTGRIKIKTNYTEVTDENVGLILAEAYGSHMLNIADIDYLYNYFVGIQPILNREKKIRPEINNKIVENHANSIVKFKTGYLLQKPIQYVSRKESTNKESMEFLNDCMDIESKESQDKEIANAQAICGVADRLAMPNKEYDPSDPDDVPFKFSTLDPRNAFVVYSSDVGEKPLIGVVVLTTMDENNNKITTLQAYTKNKYYEFIYGVNQIAKVEANPIGRIPLIEYPYNQERMGAFEPVIPILDAINNIESNRVDGIEQFIQAIMVFKNVEITKDMIEKLQELGAINIDDNGEIKANVEYLQQELNQSQIQTLVNYELEVVYRIVGMPMGNTKSGDDSGTAVIMRDGWSEAEARTQDTELMFKKSEKEFLKLVLHYMRTLTYNKYSLTLPDIEIKFTRRNYENIYQKALVLDILLKTQKVAPKIAFQTCGLFSDPDLAYEESESYYKENPTDVVS